MTPSDYRTIRKALGLTHSALAAALGVDIATTQRWEAGDRKIPPAVSTILRLLNERKISLDDVRNSR